MRLKNTRDVLAKEFQKFENLHGIWREVLGTPEKQGVWTIYGKEKNGKTWLALMMASMISEFDKVLYVSAEEGISYHFQQTLKRVGISDTNRNMCYENYLPVEDLSRLLRRRRAPRVVVLDNATIYNDDMRGGVFIKLLREFPNVLFIVMAHEEKNQPYTYMGKIAQKLAIAIFHVEGLACNVSGRCPGGRLVIDEEKAALYHGQIDNNK